MTVERVAMSEDLEPNLGLPKSWKSSLSSYRAAPVHMGLSIADVVQLTGEGLPTLFVKSEALDVPAPMAELEGDIERLKWLSEQNVLTPQVL